MEPIFPLCEECKGSGLSRWIIDFFEYTDEEGNICYEAIHDLCGACEQLK